MIALVGCSKDKLPGTHAARALYTGALFTGAMRIADAAAERVFIVSALHGLVEPGRELAAYNRQLSDVPAAERAAWGHRVASDLAAAVELHHAPLSPAGAGAEYSVTRRAPVRPIVVAIFAGADYADPIRVALAMVRPAWRIIEPMRGMAVGRRRAWLTKNAPKPPAARGSRRFVQLHMGEPFDLPPAVRGVLADMGRA